MPSAPLAEHEEMDRWKRLPVWAQQELESWRGHEAHQRGLAEDAARRVERMKGLLTDACAQLDALFDETLIRRIDEELHAER
jgi:hypothetical protein